MLFKLSNLNSNLALTLGYLNPASNNSALVNKIILRHLSNTPWLQGKVLSRVVVVVVVVVMVVVVVVVTVVVVVLLQRRWSLVTHSSRTFKRQRRKYYYQELVKSCRWNPVSHPCAEAAFQEYKPQCLFF